MGGNTSGSSSGAETGASESSDEINVLKLNTGYQYGRLKLTGVARNTADRTLSYVQIQISFYNSKGERVEISGTYTTDLKQGERWEFEIIP
ncbi:MAG: FxLYD domain-containing protein, partial [Halobacteria archaeon]|nr:FxLYD domain-containing protein [Halobacteria archaeon]